MMVPVLYTVLVMVLATVPDKLDLSLLNMSMIFVLDVTKPVNTKLSLFLLFYMTGSKVMSVGTVSFTSWSWWLWVQLRLVTH